MLLIVELYQLNLWAFSTKFEIGIKSKNIKNLTDCSRLLDEILNRKPNQHLPYVGAAAFSHKGGLHVSAVQKDLKTYGLEQRIKELESKFAKDFSQNTFDEIKKLKKEQNIN